MNTGEKIKFRRIELKMTQKKLAELSGISESAIRKYEKGERIPKVEQLQKLANALNLSSLVFLEYEDMVEKKTNNNRTTLERALILDSVSWIENYISFSSDAEVELICILDYLRNICSIENPKIQEDALKAIANFIKFTMSNYNIKLDDNRYKLVMNQTQDTNR